METSLIFTIFLNLCLTSLGSFKYSGRLNSIRLCLPIFNFFLIFRLFDLRSFEELDLQRLVYFWWGVDQSYYVFFVCHCYCNSIFCYCCYCCCSCFYFFTWNLKAFKFLGQILEIFSFVIPIDKKKVIPRYQTSRLAIWVYPVL